MRWLFLALVGCDTRSDAPPFDTVIGDPACASSAVRVGSPRYGGAPIFSSDPYLTLDRTEEGSAFTRIDVDPPVDLPYDMIDVPLDLDQLIPREPFPPGARLRLDEGYGCPVWEGDVHPAGLPVNPADLHGRTWVLRDAPGFEILTSLDEGAEFPTTFQFPALYTDGDWPIYLHAEVDADVVSWSYAFGDVATGGTLEPCSLPVPLTPSERFNSESPEVRFPAMGDVPLGGPSLSWTMFQASLQFIPTPMGTSLGLVRFEFVADPRQLADAVLGGEWTVDPDTDMCELNPIGAPLHLPLPPCLPCTTTLSGFCTDRALIILDAPAVDVPWPTEASIAANPACLAGG
jgi:hypothetical protein